MADYQLTETDIVIRTTDRMHIPNDPDNRDRVEYEAWLAAGGVPDPYVEPPPPIPAQISNRQFYHQLTLDGRMSQSDAKKAMSGNLPTITDYITTLPPEQQFGAEMQFLATTFPRDDQYVIALLQHLGVTDIDQFFTAAAVL
jgi:hypothetical protein